MFRRRISGALVVSVLTCTMVQAQDDENETQWYDDIDVDGTIVFQRERLDGVLTDDGESVSASFLRKVSVDIEKEFTDKLVFKTEIGSNRDGELEVSDAFVRYELPHSMNLTVGRFNPPFGLESTGGSGGVLAPEKSPINDILLLGGEGEDGAGAELNYASDRFHGAISLYDNDDVVSLSGRLVVSVIGTKANRWQVGASFSVSDDLISDDGESDSGMGFWSAGDDPASNPIEIVDSVGEERIEDNVETGLEIMFQRNRFSFQSEYVQRSFASESGQIDSDARGYYWQLAYTLTGETRRYNSNNATFRSLKVSNEPRFFPGAWEIYFRDSNLRSEQDGENGQIETREATSREAGINWYANEDVRTTFSYARVDAPADDNDLGEIDGSGFTIRTTFDF